MRQLSSHIHCLVKIDHNENPPGSYVSLEFPLISGKQMFLCGYINKLLAFPHLFVWNQLQSYQLLFLGKKTCQLDRRHLLLRLELGIQ